MWSDNETQVDLLDFSHLVAAAESVVRNKSLLPATVGVFGHWGSGKSSLMQMLRARLEEDKSGRTLCISFNGWLFRNVSSIFGQL
jgi:predicted KAP-like P-loop ATPase